MTNKFTKKNTFGIVNCGAPGNFSYIMYLHFNKLLNIFHWRMVFTQHQFMKKERRLNFLFCKVLKGLKIEVKMFLLNLLFFSFYFGNILHMMTNKKTIS